MFLESALYFVRGYDEVKIEGFYLERFLNLCMNRGIKIWNLTRKTEALLTCSIFSHDLEDVMKIAEITRCNLKVVSQKGIKSIALRYRKRKVFAIVLILSALCIYWYSIRIWKIEIVGDFSIPIDELYKELEQENVRIGMRKKDIDFKKIKNNIYVRRNDVSWMGFDIKGTNAVIEFVERKNKNIDFTDDKACNVISNKDGVIYKISVKTGTKMVNVGDFVSSGDVLISGIVTNKDLSTRMVHSDGEIILKTWYEGRSKVYFEKDVPNKTGKVNQDYSVQIGNYKINFINNGTNFEKYDTIESDEKLKLFNKFELPIRLNKVSYEELEVSTINYTKEQAILIAKNEAIQDVKQKIIVDEKNISDDCFKIYENDDSVSVILNIECLENTGVKQIIE